MTKAKLATLLTDYRFIKHFITAFIIMMMLTFDIAPQCNIVNAEYFSSIDSLQKLGDVELGLVDVFRKYLEMQESEFEVYRKFIDFVKEQHNIALEDEEDYLGNPINAFTLIKRMVTDWNHLHGLIKESQSLATFHEMLNEFNQNNQIPDDNELKGAVKGLARLQKIYDLQAFDLANGEVDGVSYDTELTWHDCFEIALNLYDQKDFELALTWFEVTLERLTRIEDSKKNSVERKFEIECLEYLAMTSYELGESDKAVEYIEELLDLAPDHHTKDMRLYLLNSPPKKKLLKASLQGHAWYKNYTELCQGKQIPERKFHKLKCLIETRNRPYFILAPLKVEQISLDPEINLYHGLLNDVQIGRIISEGENNMFRSQVKNGTGGITSDIRISQQAWLKYNSPIMKTVYNLVSEITGYDLKNAEYMQMANYGIGGQYDPHNDFFGPDGFKNKIWIGDRIATNMFYLSDVEQGGYTVFPKINIYARPVKGALIVWNNLHKSLDPDYRTLHAGCPVIKGSKRIGNVWIHSGYQEFRRPCDLKSDAYKSEIFMNQRQIAKKLETKMVEQSSSQKTVKNENQKKSKQ